MKNSIRIKEDVLPIQIARWADLDANQGIIVPAGPRPIKMQNSEGTGLALLKDGYFGADLIRFAAGEGVSNHVHEGAHILFVIKGSGYVEYGGTEYDLEPGICYLIPSMMDHAIRATTELVLLAVGNDHRNLDSTERMIPTY